MIVVTGSTGLIGSHLLYRLVSKGVKVRAIKRANSNTEIVRRVFSYYSNNANELFNLIEWVEGDVCDRSSLDDAFKGASKVYHAAALVSFDPGMKKKLIEVNIGGTANVVDACLLAGVKKLCHVSSVAAIGQIADGGPCTEEMIWLPGKHQAWYPISKFHGEMEVWRGIEEGLNAVIINPSVVIGPGNWGQSSTALFTTIYKGLKFYPPGTTGYVDVRDVAMAMEFAMDSEITGERFIIDENAYTFKDIFSTIAIALKKTPPSIKVKPWMASVAWRAEWLRCKILGHSPQITRASVASGFRSTVYSNEKSCRMLGMTYIPVKKSIEEFAGMYLNDIKNLK